MTGPELVRARLLALAPVTALVDTRIYVLLFPQNLHATTAIRLERISSRATVHARGDGAPWRERIQVDMVAPTVAEAYAIDAAVLGPGDGSALAGWTGAGVGAFVQACLADTMREIFEPQEIRLVHLTRDYFLTYTSAPAALTRAHERTAYV